VDRRRGRPPPAGWRERRARAGAWLTGGRQLEQLIRRDGLRRGEPGRVPARGAAPEGA
jgi:hypothetical protein